MADYQVVTIPIITANKINNAIHLGSNTIKSFFVWLFIIYDNNVY